MSAAAIFAGAFLILAVTTFVVPILPPAQMVYNFLNISQPTTSIWGIPVVTLLLCATNGLLWASFATAVYSLSRHFSRRKPLSPLPAPQKLPSTPPKPTPLDRSEARYPAANTVRKKRGRIGQDVETIEGIGSLRGEMLRNAGIRTLDDLLRAGATRMKRQRLANEFGVSYSTMDKWVYRGDLLRIRGIGRQYSELLETAGIAPVTDLSRRSPSYLWQKLREINRRRKIVKRIPPLKTIETWVYRAKNLEPMVE